MGLKCSSLPASGCLTVFLEACIASRELCSMIDDILVFSKQFETHLGHVQEVLERLRKAGLTANTEK